MAKGSSVSLSPKDFSIGGGLFGAGPATAKEHRWGIFDYNGKAKPQTALLVTFERDGEEHIEAMTVGQGWKPSSDGTQLIPKAGQKSLNSSCKAAQYLSALADDGGMPDDFLDGGDITLLDGIEGTLVRKPLEMSGDRLGKKGEPPTVLIFEGVESAPWQKDLRNAVKSAKKKAVAEDDDDDSDGDGDDDDDEKPAKKKGSTKKAAAADDDDDDEDAAPAKSKGKKAAAASDDDDDEALLETGIEALIAALEDGPVRLKDVEGAVLNQLKKHKQRQEIAELMANPKTLKQEKGWSFDGKKVTLD